MMKTVAVLGFSMLAFVACSAAEDEESVGESAKALMSAKEIAPVLTACQPGTQHPNICCAGEACFKWLDNPFRACTPGFKAIPDGSQCCSPQSKLCGPVLPKPQPPEPPKPTAGYWESYTFSVPRAFSACEGGPKFVKFSERYGKWVGVELCSTTKYKIYLGESKTGSYYEIGDFAGHGQDHCELVNEKFSLKNEDDITSGGCKDCNLEMGPWQNPGPVPVYSRSTFGSPFDLRPWPEHNLYTSLWYSCGVAIVGLTPPPPPPPPVTPTPPVPPTPTPGPRLCTPSSTVEREPNDPNPNVLQFVNNGISFCGHSDGGPDVDRFAFVLPADARGFSASMRVSDPKLIEVAAEVDGIPFNPFDGNTYPFRPGSRYLVSIKSKNGLGFDYLVNVNVSK